MNVSNRRFKVIDGLLVGMAVLPLIFGMMLRILTKPASEGIQVTGAQVYFTIPMPIMDLPVTEAQVNSLLVILSLAFLCLYLTHGLSVKEPTKRQLVAEWIVEKTEGLVVGNMGEYFVGFGPFIAAMLALSAFSSLFSLLGLFPPTSDINIPAGWAIVVFALITYYKCKCGPVHYLKGFLDPVPVMLPMNIVGELANPLAMAFRQYGNVLSGSVISVLVAAAFQGLSTLVLGWLPGILGEIPFLQIGVPAVLSIYFDIFSGCLQAYIFAMLTMLYVAGGFPEEEYKARQAKKKIKKQKTA